MCFHPSLIITLIAESCFRSIAGEPSAILVQKYELTSPLITLCGTFFILNEITFQQCTKQ